MILSFSVPEDNKKYAPIVNWYKDQPPQERSREFRAIFLAYLTKNPHNTTDERQIEHVSLKIEKVVNNGNDDEDDIDFDSKFNLIGRR